MKVEESFWTEYLDSAIRIIINLVITFVLFILFYCIISIVAMLIRRAMNVGVPSKTVTATRRHRMTYFVVGLVKAILWVQIIPILVNQARWRRRLGGAYVDPPLRAPPS